GPVSELGLGDQDDLAQAEGGAVLLAAVVVQPALLQGRLPGPVHRLLGVLAGAHPHRLRLPVGRLGRVPLHLVPGLIAALHLPLPRRVCGASLIVPTSARGTAPRRTVPGERRTTLPG